MKTIVNSVKHAGCMLILLCICLIQAHAQKAQDKMASIQNSIDTRNFVFVAQSLSPLRGGVRQLTSYYDLRVSKDTVTSNLPYFGRAYTAPMNPSDGGLNFTSLATGYVMKTKKKGRREIAMQTKSADDSQRLSLTVFDYGSASLQVTSNNRDPVSFDGYIKETGKK